MHKLSCHCLNVHMVHRTTLKNRDDVPFSPDHEFFDRGFYILNDNLQASEQMILSKEIKELVSSTLIATDWEICKCLNCNTVVYCVHLPTRKFYASGELLTNLEIKQRMKDPNFSNVYQIVLPTTHMGISDGHDPETLPFSVKNKYNSYVSTQKNEVRDKVERYQQELEVELNRVMNEAASERNTLMNLMHSHQRLRNQDLFHGNTEDFARSEATYAKDTREQDFDISQLEIYGEDLSQPDLPEDDNSSSDFDDDDQFDLEDVVRHGSPSLELDDNADRSALDPFDDSGEFELPVARSVPISIPINQLMGKKTSSRRGKDRQQGSRSVRQTVDIAASMQAISRSMNPNPFGELPSPKKRSLYSRAIRDTEHL